MPAPGPALVEVTPELRGMQPDAGQGGGRGESQFIPM